MKMKRLLRTLMQGQLSKAAKLYVEESHQLAAWNYLEGQIPDEVLDEFFELYSAATECMIDHATGDMKEIFSAVK